MKHFFRTLAISICLVSTTQQAFADRYVCEMKGTRPGEWIQKDLVIDHDTKTGKVLVSDAVILHYFNRPIEGRVDVDNDRRRTFKWSVEGAKDSKGQYGPSMDYSATYRKGTGKVSVSMIPVGYANHFKRGGKCKVSK